MRRSGVRRVGACLVLLSGLPAGCAGLSGPGWKSDFPSPVSATAPPSAGPRTAASPQPPPAIKLASATADGAAPAPLPPPAPLSGMTELTPEALIDQVLARNPSLAQMVAAWQAAAARYPQVTSLDDPMLGTALAPAAVGQLGDGNRGYRIDLSQKLPGPGKLGLRGENARAALMARGLAEMLRLARAKGARMETLMGLSGLGDLALTCGSLNSRNMSLGIALGEGRTLDEVLAGRRAVTEGVPSAVSITTLAGRLGIEMPICSAVHSILHQGMPVREAMDLLLSRPQRPELDADHG